MVSTETGRVLQTFGPIASPPNDPVPAAATLRERVMGALAAEHGAGRLAGMTHNPPSYDAYREYVEGDRQFNVGRNAEAYRHYTAAVRLDTTFTYALVRAAGAAYYATSVLSPSRCITVDSIQRVLAARQRLVSEYDERYLERVRSWCTGDWSAAFAAARRMAELAPRSEDAAYIAGRSALYLERPQSALQFFRRIDFNRGEWRGSDQALRDLTTAYHLLDDVDAEWTTLERLDLPIGSDVTRLRVRALAALHRGRAADSLVVEAEAAPRRAVEVYITAIGELRRHGEGAWSDSVAKRFVAYSARAPQQDAAYGRAVRGYALLLAHRDREAKQMFDSLVSVNFAPSRTLGVAGVAAARLGDRPAADGFSRRLAEIAATVPQGEASYARAQIATALGRKEEAVELLRQALSEGIPYYFGIHFISSIHIDHADPLLQPLNGYAPYELLLHPKG
jgi:tetratricopeptide (TPR) repeat protein